ncbi:MAG: hypothetical protein GOU99_00010 [Candidatus Altiarchaeota archaeon]|nr:hypothetical protein [Candidatus Altiarchaeota archaeon]
MIKARFIIEAQGQPKSFVKNSLKQLIEKIKGVQGVEVYDEHWEDVEKQESGLLSGLVDIGISSVDAETFFAIMLAFGPSAIILEEPAELKISMGQMQNITNDIIEVLHAFARANAELRLKR